MVDLRCSFLTEQAQKRDWLAINAGQSSISVSPKNIAPKIFREEHKEEGKERRIECGSDRAIYKLFVLSFLCPIGELIVTLGCA